MPDPFSGFPDDDEPAPSPITRFGGGFPDERPDPLSQTISRLPQTSPDTAARIFDLRVKTGLPATVIERNLDLVTQQTARKDFDAATFREQHPELSKWILDDPVRASIAQDDLPSLGAVERALRVWSDAEITVAKGLIGVPEFVVGLQDILYGGRWGKFLDDRIGFRPAAWRAFLDRRYSPAQQAKFQAFQEADGPIAKAAAALANPSIIAHAVVESLPVMFGGAGVARGILSAAPKMSGVIAAAIGEGAAGAGMAAEQTRQASPDQTLTAGQSALSVASGVFTGGLAILGGRIAQQLGIADVDTLLAGAVATPAAARGLARRLVYGAVSEGFLEELPQSIQEQVLQNAAQDRPLTEGVSDSAVLGLFAGAVMGSGANALPRSQRVIEAAHAGAEASKTRERAPGAFDSFVEQIAASGLKEVIVPADTFATYFQSKGQDPARVADALTGDPTAWTLAQTTNDLVIPTARYLSAIVGSGHEAFFAKEIRLGVDSPNGRETQERIAEEAAPEADVSRETAPDTLQATMQARLLATGRVGQQEAEDVATQIAAVFPNAASRAGLDLDALVAQWLPQVQAGEPGVRRPGTMFQGVDEYGGAHRPPDAETGAPAHDLTGAGRIYPDDVYESDGPRIYGTGDAALDRQSFRILNRIKGRSDAEITIYRAIPKGVEDRTIHAGDWVSINRRYVEQHGERFDEGFEVVEKTVTASEIFTNSDSIHEWGYSPAITGEQQPSLPGAESVRAQNIATPQLDAPFSLTPEVSTARTGRQDTLFQGPRGSISFPPGESPLIKLFASKNRSTLFHESAHLFLRMFGSIADHLRTLDPATLTASQQQILDDMVTLDGWFTSPDATARQEQFARGHEAYVMEGTAPSLALRGVFARASSWLLRIYRGVATRAGLTTAQEGLSRDAGFEVQLTPAVRAVMARMMASDEAIAEAEQDAGVQALFTTAEQAQIPPAEFEGYRKLLMTAHDEGVSQLQTRVMQDLARDEQDWWQTERAAVKADVTAEVHQEPVYRALSAIRRGTNPDGSPLVEGTVTPPLRLSKEALVAQFGPDVLSRLPRPYVYTSTEARGLPPDLVAPMVGFETGADMVQAMIAAPKMSAKIESETDARMAERHGDILSNPGELAEQAQQAIAEDHRDTVIRAEVAMLRKLQAATAPVKAEARAARTAGARRLRTELPDAATLTAGAQAQIASMRLRDVRPDRFFAAAKRASKQATQAAAKQDFDTAIQAKHAELINLALYREALVARDAVNEARTDFEQMFGSDKTLAKRRDMDYVHAARTLAATYFWPERRLDTAREAMQVIKGNNRDLFILLDDQVSAVLAFGTNLNALPVDAFRAMAGTVRALWEQSLRSQQQLIDGQLVDRREAADSIIARFDVLGPPPPPRGPVRTFLLGGRATFTRMEHWVSHIDANDSFGVLRRFLFTPGADAIARYHAAKPEAIQAWFDAFTKIQGTLTQQPIQAPELLTQMPDGSRRAHTFDNLAQVLHAIGHTGNESNLSKLLRGYGWVTSVSPVKGVAVDPSQWRAFMARMFRDKIITEAHMDFVQATWDVFEGLKPQAQRSYREQYGHYFKEVPLTPVETPWKTYAGGYLPLVYDPFRSADGAARASLDVMGEVHPGMFGEPSFAQARVEQYAQPLALNLSLLPSHIDKALRFIHLQPRAMEMLRLLKDRRLRERIHAYDPALIEGMLEPWLKRLVSQRVDESSTGRYGQSIDRVLRVMRSRGSMIPMVGNISNTVQQFTGILTSMVWLKAHAQPGDQTSPSRYLRSALWRYIWDAKRISAQQDEDSVLLRTAGSGQVAEMLRTMDDVLLNPSTFDKLSEFTKVHGYFMQVATQNIVSRVTWAAAYEQAMERPGLAPADAVRIADAAVRETQGTGRPEDISSFEVQRPFVRLFTPFYSWANMMANLNGYQQATIWRDMGLKKGAGRALYTWFFGYYALALVSDAIRQSIGGWDDDDDDSHLDELMAFFFAAPFRLTMQMIPGGLDEAAFNYYFTQSIWDDRVSTSPAIQAYESAVKAPFEVYEAITDDTPARQAVRDTLTLLQLVTGAPTGALIRPAGYLTDVIQGEEAPESATEFARGVTSGRRQAAP